MVDALDSKSSTLKSVSVRVRPSAPLVKLCEPEFDEFVKVFLI